MRINANIIILALSVIGAVAFVAQAKAAEDCDQKATNDKTFTACGQEGDSCKRKKTGDFTKAWCVSGDYECRSADSTTLVSVTKYTECTENTSGDVECNSGAEKTDVNVYEKSNYQCDS